MINALDTRKLHPWQTTFERSGPDMISLNIDSCLIVFIDIHPVAEQQHKALFDVDDDITSR